MEDANENGKGGNHDDMQVGKEFANGEESSAEDESFDENESSVEDESSREDRLEVLLRQVDKYDPNLMTLSIQIKLNDDLFNDIGHWHCFGAIIGRNTHLVELTINIYHLGFPSQGGGKFI